MDPIIVKDTVPIHWSLDQQQMTEFLAKLDPGNRLFSPLNTALNADDIIENILTNLQVTQHRLKDNQAYFLEVLNSEPLEERITEFFNGIIQHAPNLHTWMR
jgi:hypothetical protein